MVIASKFSTTNEGDEVQVIDMEEILFFVEMVMDAREKRRRNSMSSVMGGQFRTMYHNLLARFGTTGRARRVVDTMSTFPLTLPTISLIQIVFLPA